jgi:plastocyanin
MNAKSRLMFCLACVILLIVSCMAAGCSSSQAPPATAAPTTSTTGGNTVIIKNFAFDPSSLTVKSGPAVKWTNQDGTPHTIVSDTGSMVAFSSDSISSGASYSFTFTQPGTYTYHCSIHPTMKGNIIVNS